MYESHRCEEMMKCNTGHEPDWCPALNRAILDCPCHPASWGPIMRRAPTLSGRRSTGFLSPATRCSAGSSATSSTSCCETAIQTYVRKTQRPVTLKYHKNTHDLWLFLPLLLSVSAAVPAGDKGLHEEQGWSNRYEQDVGEDAEIVLLMWLCHSMQSQEYDLMQRRSAGGSAFWISKD